MPHLRRWLGSGLILLGLASCSTGPDESVALDFDTDPRILRGMWEGSSDTGETLRLEARASDPTAEGYAVTGTFSFMQGEPVAFSGLVYVPVVQESVSLAAQVSEPCTFSARSSDDAWQLCGRAREGSPPNFSLDLIELAEIEEKPIIWFPALTKVQDEQSTTGTLVSGTINHLKGEPYTYPGDFDFTEDSHAVVQLYYSWSALGDAPIELMAETRLEDITALPLNYRLEGDVQKTFLRQGDYFLHVNVYSGAEDDAEVGDLLNEWFTPVPSPGATVDVTVIGLESCDSPDVGGVCATP